MKHLLPLLLACLPIIIQAQDSIHISGHVLDEDAVPISYATIVVLDSSKNILCGTPTDYDGFYDLTFDASLPVAFCRGSAFAYKDSIIPLTKEPNQVIDIGLNTIDCSQAEYTMNNLLTPSYYWSGSDNIVCDTLIPQAEPVHFAYIVTPAFGPEYGLVYNRHEKKFIYSEVVGSHSMWYSIHSKKNYVIKRRELKLESIVSDSMYVLMRTAISTASAPKEDPECEIFVLDGIRYRFIAYRYTAECWSPDSGNNAELVRIMDAACQAVKTRNVVKLKALLPDISRLTKEYDKYVCR